MADKDRETQNDLRDTEAHVTLGKNIRAIRDSMNLSREVLSERAGINADYLGEIERGEKWPALWMIRKIARELGVSTARFFQFEDEEADTADPADKIQQTLNNRSPEEQRQALRVINALFDLRSGN